MKSHLLLLPLLLAACVQQQHKAPEPNKAEQPAATQAPEKTQEHWWWDSYGMSKEFYEAASTPLNEDNVEALKRLCSESKRQPDQGLLRLCCANQAPRCLKWVLRQGVKVNTSHEYWSDVCTTFCSDVDEEEADKVRHILFPLLKANPKLLQKEFITPIVIYLAEHGCRQSMKQLLAMGAPAEVADPRGRTALDYARFYQYKEVEKLLRAHGAKRVTLNITMEEHMKELQRKAEAERKQRWAEYEAQMKARKDGDPWPAVPVVGPELIHRPALP